MSRMNWNRPNGGYERLDGTSSGGFKVGAKNLIRNLKPQPVEIKVSPCLEHAVEVKHVENHPHLWCIACDRSIMPLTTTEYTNYLMLNKPISKQGFTVDFGKFKGRPIAEVPTSYIQWVIINVADQRINAIFNSELAKRKSK